MMRGVNTTSERAKTGMAANRGLSMRARSPPVTWAGLVIAAMLALVLEIVAAAAWSADTEKKRVALVVGIGAYQYAPPLANPPNDVVSRRRYAGQGREDINVRLGSMD